MDYTSLVLVAAKAVKVPASLLLAICMHESGLKNTMVPHDGGSPTYGICQIKLDTARGIGYQGGPKGLMEPFNNAYWAAKYLKYQMKRYDGDWCMAAAAYNSGTYNESKVMPGYPRNLKYVRHVQRKLASVYQHRLSCQ